MNIPAAENYESEEILYLLFTSEMDQLHQWEVWDRIGSDNELSMAYTLFQSFLEASVQDPRQVREMERIVKPR